MFVLTSEAAHLDFLQTFRLVNSIKGFTSRVERTMVVDGEVLVSQKGSRRFVGTNRNSALLFFFSHRSTCNFPCNSSLFKDASPTSYDTIRRFMHILKFNQYLLTPISVALRY